MKRVMFGLFSLLVLLQLGVANARAEELSGDYTVSFNGAVNVWDISGTYDVDLDGLKLGYTVEVDPAGKFQGQGYMSFHEGWDYLDGTLFFSGSIKSVGDVTSIVMNMKLTGSGVVSGYSATFKATMKETMEIDTANKTMVGTASGKISVAVPGVGKQSMPLEKITVEDDLPADMDGTWDVELHVAADGTKYTGTAKAELSNGRNVPFDLKGSYSAKKDTSKLALKGAGLNRGMSMNVSAVLTNAQFQVQSLKGKLLGQKVQVQPRP
jgi:hypothetical protein